MKSIITFFASLTFLSLVASSSWDSGSMQDQILSRQMKQRICIENRVLTCINDKPITVLDVMKKMDSIFFREYPHLADSDIAKYQFYKANWDYFFNDMINSELIVLDAKSKKMEITHGDIREELERIYGPQIIINIDNVGLTYDEAWNMVEKELFVQRMLGNRLHLRGAYNTTPSDLIAAYKDYNLKNQRPDIWSYNFITFRGPNALENAQMASDILSNIKAKNNAFKTMSLIFKDKVSEFEKQEISFSKEFELNDTQLSKSHQDVLTSLEEKTFSKPKHEVNAKDNSSLYRIFYLAHMEKGGDIDFLEVEKKLKDQIINERTNLELTAYFAQIREKNGISDEFMKHMTPDGFEPFTIK